MAADREQELNDGDCAEELRREEIKGLISLFKVLQFATTSSARRVAAWSRHQRVAVG